MHVVVENPFLYIGIGNIIAALLSWKRNRDGIWSAIAFLLGWLYVVYWVVTDR